MILRVPPRLIAHIEASQEHADWLAHRHTYLPDVALFKALAKGRKRGDDSRVIHLAKGHSSALAWWADHLRDAPAEENDRRANVRTGTSVLRQIEIGLLKQTS